PLLGPLCRLCAGRASAHRPPARRRNSLGSPRGLAPRTTPRRGRKRGADRGRSMRILITGAGGAAAISVWKSLSAEHELHMADMDPLATGLYLVPVERRLIIPRGDAPELVPAL